MIEFDRNNVGLSLKRLLQKGFRAFGYHLGQYPPRGSLGHLLQDLLRILDVSCVLDVGAHQGGFAASLRDIGYKGRIVSFEPVKASFEALQRDFGADPNWRGYNLALGAKDGELSMNVYPHSVFNSFLRPNDYGMERFARDLNKPHVEVVPIRRLDAMFDECVAGLPNPKVMLKIDTQGFDMEVLEGAKGCLDRVQALQSEVSVKPIYEGMPTISTALSRFAELGFEPSGMFPISRDTNQLSVIEFDCVMVRMRKDAAAKAAAGQA